MIGWPQLIWIALVSLKVASEIINHGKPRPTLHNGYAAVVWVLLSAGLLYWGGFFG